MNNKTKNFIAFAFTAFVFVFASHANAAITSNSDFVPDYTIYGNTVVSNSPQYSVYDRPSPAKLTSVNNSVNSNSSANSSSSNSDANKVAGTSANSATVDTANGVSTNNLPALSMYGTNSFMPDTVFEWFFTIILILVLIIIIRLMIRANNKGHGHH